MTQNMKRPVIVFDFGGVLIDWSPYYLYRKVISNDEEIKLFLEEINFAAWNSQFDKGYPFTKGVEEKCTQFPHRTELIQRFNSHWLETMGELMSDTAEILSKLKQAGYPIYGLSNWSIEKFNLVKNRFDFLNWLDDYLLSGQVLQIKPEPDIYHLLLKKIGRSATECLFIDDSAANIEAAKKIGFQTIQFQSAEQLASELTRMGIQY